MQSSRLDYGAHYRIHGRWIGEPPADHNYTPSGNAHFMNSLGTLQHNDIEREPDGSFMLSVGPEPGERNHIRTMPGAEYLFVPDCWADWRQAATALTVERLDKTVNAPVQRGSDHEASGPVDARRCTADCLLGTLLSEHGGRMS